jgi:hypothetical protein
MGRQSSLRIEEDRLLGSYLHYPARLKTPMVGSPDWNDAEGFAWPQRRLLDLSS